MATWEWLSFTLKPRVTCATGIQWVEEANDVHVHNKYTFELLSANSAAIKRVRTVTLSKYKMMAKQACLLVLFQ